mgnify:CR=1 FL=1
MFKKGVILFFLLIACIGIYLISIPLLEDYYLSRFYSVNKKECSYFITKNISLEDLANDLIKAHIVEDKDAFLQIAKESDLSSSTIAKGKYIIKPKTTYKKLVWGFKKNTNGQGNAEKKVNVTIYSRKNIEELAFDVEKCIAVDSINLINNLFSKKTQELFDFKDSNEIISIFSPGIYKMYYDTDENKFIEFFKKKYDFFWNQKRTKRIKELGLKDKNELITLASIVYSEQSKVKNEWSTIAAVYLNRLKKGMKLESDPTFKYCWGDKLDGVQRLLNKHRKIDCPYNTYNIHGLPPGPLCIIPLSVIDSVLNYKKVDYIFMCAKPNYSGEHNFASTNKEHSKNAFKYQKWIANEQKHKNE